MCRCRRDRRCTAAHDRFSDQIHQRKRHGKGRPEGGHQGKTRCFAATHHLHLQRYVRPSVAELAPNRVRRQLSAIGLGSVGRTVCSMFVVSQKIMLNSLPIISDSWKSLVASICAPTSRHCWRWPKRRATTCDRVCPCCSFSATSKNRWRWSTCWRATLAKRIGRRVCLVFGVPFFRLAIDAITLFNPQGFIISFADSETAQNVGRRRAGGRPGGGVHDGYVDQNAHAKYSGRGAYGWRLWEVSCVFHYIFHIILPFLLQTHERRARELPDAKDARSQYDWCGRGHRVVLLLGSRATAHQPHAKLLCVRVSTVWLCCLALFVCQPGVAQNHLSQPRIRGE